MGFYGIGCDLKLLGNLFIGKTMTKKQQHFSFPIAELVIILYTDTRIFQGPVF